MAKKKKSARRVKGTGSIFGPNAKGRYIGRVIVGRKTDGSVKYAQRSALTVKALQAKLATVRPATDETTLTDWLDLWMASAKCKPATRRIRLSVITNHLKPSLGHHRVSELTAFQVEAAAGAWKLEASSACAVLSVLGTAMRASVRAGLRKDNPVRDAAKPRIPRTKIDPFTLPEITAIAKEAATRYNTRAFAVLAATGMRVGECLALDVPDFDSAVGAISITKTLDNATRELGSPKSENGVRTIQIPELPAEGLVAIRAAIGARTAGTVFCTSSGRRATYHLLHVAWGAMLKRLGIRYRPMHELRHAFASHSLAAKVDVAELARYLGDTPQTIIRTYTHATGTVNAAELFAGLFRGPLGEDKVAQTSQKTSAPKKSRRKRAR